MQEILVNVNEEKDKTIVLVENGKLIEQYSETANQKRLEGNIYIGRVENVLIGMQAAFINIGEKRNTFIHIRDIIPKVSNETGNKNESLSKHDIKSYIRVGMPILVQVKRDSTNKKGARVSTHLSFPGRFVVLMPQTNFITISQKIEGEEERQRLKTLVSEVLPNGYGIIIRTAAEKKDAKLIQNEIQRLVNIEQNIQKQYSEAEEQKNAQPQLVYQSPDVTSKLLLDVMDLGIDRILTNNKDTYEEIEKIMGENNKKIAIEMKEQSVLEIYGINKQLEELKNRKVWLKCGGFITIDKTEALTAIDVNSGKYIGGKELEQTIYTVNKEATIEIAKQLRMRDIGGIVIIDYIDMEKQETRDKIVDLLKQNLKKDRSKTQVIGFTPLNLMEMTRKHMCSND